jgi:uncharacterized phage-like protein YoqJ
MSEIIEKVACFTGHRRIASAELPRLKQCLYETIETLIQQGVTTFLCGGAIGFDTLAGNIVVELKKLQHNQAQNGVALPQPR